MKTSLRKFLTSGLMVWILLVLFTGATILLLPYFGVSSVTVVLLIWAIGAVVLLAGAKAVEEEKSVKELFKDIGESLGGLLTVSAGSIFIFILMSVVIFPFLAAQFVIDKFHAGFRDGKPFLIVELSAHWWVWGLGMGLWAIGVFFILRWRKRLKKDKS